MIMISINEANCCYYVKKIDRREYNFTLRIAKKVNLGMSKTYAKQHISDKKAEARVFDIKFKPDTYRHVQSSFVICGHSIRFDTKT